MPGWAWAVVAVVAIIVVALVVWQALKTRKTRTLQDQFGPEYDRTLERAEGKREGEADLAARVKRRDELDIRPLSAAARDRYADTWQNYRAGHRLAGSGDTEEQRQAMVHYRSLFDELLEDSADRPLSRDEAPDRERETAR